jgi:hypothetical protein
VEWSLLLFFGALFVVMRGARDLPLIASLTSAAGAQLHGAPIHDAVVTSAAMLALSNLVSNVPAVVLWLPVVPKVAAPSFIWLAMAMSSTFAGNLTLPTPDPWPNLIVAERARRAGRADGVRRRYFRVCTGDGADARVGHRPRSSSLRGERWRVEYSRSSKFVERELLGFRMSAVAAHDNSPDYHEHTDGQQ